MSDQKPKIGFIGLGLMGAAMAQRLQSLDYELTVVAHRNRKPIEEAVSRGATEAANSAEVAKNSKVVMICVNTTSDVESVMQGDTGVLAELKPGSLVIDFSTSNPVSTRTLYQECRKKGASMMDSPVTRTPAEAIDGRLNILAAGDEADFARVKPVLDDLGENVFHVGPIGAGHTLKLINNFFSMTTACAMSEAFAMADLAGLKRDTLYQVMSSGPNRSVMMDWIKAAAVDKDPNVLAFSIANGLKDVTYYSSMADDFKVPSFISPATKNALSMARSNGWENKMVPEMVNFIADLYSKK